MNRVFVIDEEEKSKFYDFYNSKRIQGRYYLEFPLGWEGILAEAQERSREKKILAKALGETSI